MIGAHAHNTLSVGLCREILIQFLVVEEATREVFFISARFLDGRCILFRIHRVRAKKKKLKTSYFTEVQYHMLRVQYPITAFIGPPLAVKQLLVEDLLQKILQVLVQAAY